MTRDPSYKAPQLGSGAISWASVATWGLQFAAVLSCFVQLLIDRSEANVISSLLILASSTITVQYLRLTRGFQRVPLSSFALLGFCVTTQWGALVFQSVAWTPVAQNLRDPARTFAFLGLYQCVAVLAHVVFSHLNLTMSARRVVADRILAPLGVFQVPSANALWLFGAVGAATSYITNSGFEHGVGDKFLAGAAYFRVAPFLIPLLHRRYGSAYCDWRPHAVALVAYFLISAGVGIATNARLLTFGGLMTVGVLFLLFALADQRPVTPGALWKLVPLAVSGVLLLNVSAYLASAMLVARAYHDRNHTTWDVVEETVDALRHPDKIEAYRQKDDTTAYLSLYDEKYIDNPVLARIVETKYHDNMLFFSRGVREQDVQETRDVVVDRLWSQIPTPVLKWLKIPVDKGKLQYSMGDFWIDLRYGKGLGGYAVGSMFADGTVLFGTWFPAMYLVLCVLMFFVWECLSQPEQRSTPRISLVALMMSVMLFQYGITSESISSLLALPLRGFLQNIAFYVLALWSTRLVLPPFVPPDDRSKSPRDAEMKQVDIVDRMSTRATVAI